MDKDWYVISNIKDFNSEYFHTREEAELYASKIRNNYTLVNVFFIVVNKNDNEFSNLI